MHLHGVHTYASVRNPGFECDHLAITTQCPGIIFATIEDDHLEMVVYT